MNNFGELRSYLLWIGILICLGVYVLKKKRRYNLPPGPTGLPFVGILTFLGDNPHVELTKLGKKYGGIFSVYLGRTYVVVVTDAVIARRLLSQTSTADRPPNLFKFLPGGTGFAELNGPEWVEQRRYTVMEMKNLGFGRSHWETLIQMEISDFLDLLAQSKGEPLDILDMLSASISNNVLSLVTNNSLPMADPRRDVLDRGIESFELVYGQSGLVIYYPTLFKFFVNLGLLKVGQRLKDMMNMNKCIRQEIEEIKQDKEGVSFISNYLKEIEKRKRLNLENSFNYDNLVGNVQALIMAGSDTTRVSFFWLLLAMASFRNIQEKVHKELDTELGKDGCIDWVDRQKLPYCIATILEGQRWRTVVTLNVLHRTNEVIVINGYDIPKETNLLTVQWAFHNDTKYWKDPDKFQPERFLTDDGKTDKEPEAFLPFSHGKRTCPGKTVALIEVFQYFVSTMQRFRVLPAFESCPPDLEGIPGLTLQPKRQSLRFIPR